MTLIVICHKKSRIGLAKSVHDSEHTVKIHLIVNRMINSDIKLSLNMFKFRHIGFKLLGQLSLSTIIEVHVRNSHILKAHINI